MSTLSSASSLVQVQAAYDDNASYAEDRDVAKCRTFITACRILLRRSPQQATHGRGGSIQLNLSVIQAEMNVAKRWLLANDTSQSGVIFPDMQNWRG